MDGYILYKLCALKYSLAIVPDFLDNTEDNVRTIPFRWNFTWDIYGTCLKEKSNSELIRKANEYFEKIMSDCKKGTGTMKSDRETVQGFYYANHIYLNFNIVYTLFKT